MHCSDDQNLYFYRFISILVHRVVYLQMVYIMTFQRSPESYGMQSRKMKFVILKKYTRSILLISFYTIHFFLFFMWNFIFLSEFLILLRPFTIGNFMVDWAMTYQEVTWRLVSCFTVTLCQSGSWCQSLGLIFSTWNASSRLQESGWIKSWFPSEVKIPFTYIGGSNGPFCTSSLIHKLWTIVNTSGLMSMLTQQNTLLVWLSI